MEESVGIGGFGYPGLVIVSTAPKAKYSVLTCPFEQDAILDFLKELTKGFNGQVSPIKGGKLPKIDTIDPWDGKDGEMPVEEEIDLSDVELDDLDIKDEL